MSEAEDVQPLDDGSHLDYWSWDALRNSVAETEVDLPQTIRDAALPAIDRLEFHLGSTWPSSEDARGHPVRDIFWNRAEWTRVRLADLARAMDAVQHLDGWAGLRGRLRHGRMAAAALLELDVAARALGRGLGVVLEPATTPTRRADLAVTSPRRTSTLYVEITGIAQLGQRATDALRLHDELLPLLELIEADLEAGGRVIAEITPELDDRVRQDARAFWDECKTTRRAQRRVIAGVLELWCEPFDGGAEPATERTIFSGPISEDPFRRIVRAVREKVAQLPTVAPGLVIVRSPAIALHQAPGQLAAFGEALATELSRWPQLNAAALTFESLSSLGQAGSRRISTNVLVRPRRHSHIWMQTVVLVQNPSRRYPDADELVSMVTE